MKFTYGNLFKGESVSLLEVHKEFFQLENGENVSQKKLLRLYEIWKSSCPLHFGFPTTINLLFYWNDTAYLDVHIQKAPQAKINTFMTNVSLSEVFTQKWRNYEKALDKAMKNNGEQINSEGHWLSKDLSARSFEEDFLNIVDSHYDELTTLLQKSSSFEDRAIAGYLLQWSTKKNEVFNLLMATLKTDPEHLVHNNLLRALTAIAHKVAITSENAHKILDLIFHENSLCINKGLMFVWDIQKTQPEVFRAVLKEDRYRNRIVLLAKAIQPNISDPAQDLLTLK